MVTALSAALLVAYDVTPAAVPAGSAGGSRAEAAPSADAATVVIDRNGFRNGFDPSRVSLAAGGILTVVNFDTVDHTLTSVVRDELGRPLFDVRVAAGRTATVEDVERLAAGSWDFFCKFHPAMRGVLVVDGGGGVGPPPPTFDQPLVVPEVLSGDHVRLVMRQAEVRVLPQGPRTRMWTYGGTYPGPTIRRRAGRHTSVTVVNRLPRAAGSTSMHLHGGHHAPEHDGQPTTQLVERGSRRTYEFPLTYDGRPQPGSFFWYHDHRMGRTARNNWRGLQGMFIVTDPPRKGVRLPRGPRDVPLMISERSFRADNQLTDPFAAGPEMVGDDGEVAWTGENAPPDDATVGDTVLVNGRYAPYLRVSATRYRLRLLNSSSFSSYNLAFSDDRPFVQVGTGSGLLPRPVVRRRVLLGPAQRADVVVDFSGATGREPVLESVPAERGESGDDAPEAPIMQFRVGAAARDRSRIPARLPSPALAAAPRSVAKTWTFDLGGSDRQGTYWSINGRAFDPDRVDHRAVLGTTERWRVRNTSEMTHSVHIHAGQWRTLLRNGRRPPPWERGLEDTWRLEPGEVIEVASRFADYTGPFMIHCHMLDHEDHGMMARFDVVRR